MTGLSIKAITWKFKTAAIKSWVRLQDRYGWYSYADWMRKIEANAINMSDWQSNKDKTAQQISFTIIIPYGPGDDGDLARTLASVISQTFPYWKILLLTQSSESPAPLGAIKLRDARIASWEIKRCAAGKNPYQDILDGADLGGGYICRLLPGDTLSPHALFEIAQTLMKKPEIDILYTDEDQLGRDGTCRKNPLFKPDWSPELLFSYNYLDRAFIRAQLLTKVAYLSKAEEVYEDLIYRSVEAAECINHVPLVVVHTGRARNSIHATPSAEQHLRSVSDHAKRIGIHDHPQVLYTAEGITHLTWPIEEKKVAIIIPTRDKPDYLRRCLRSLMDTTTYNDYTITLVDSESRDPETLRYYKELKKNPQISIVELQGEFNFSAALNFGAQHTKEDFLIFLNNDVEIIQSSWLEEMVRWSNIPDIGIVGGKLLYPDGKIQHAGIIMGMEGHASHIFGGAEDGVNGPFGSVNWYRNYSAVTAACMGMRREVYEQIGGFDEEYKLVFNDVEICLRAINAGYRVVYTPFAQLIHHEGGTRGHFIPAEDIHLGYEHMKDIVAQGDPYFNPNISHTVRIPTLKRPFEETSTERLKNIVKYS